MMHTLCAVIKRKESSLENSKFVQKLFTHLIKSCSITLNNIKTELSEAPLLGYKENRHLTASNLMLTSLPSALSSNASSFFKLCFCFCEKVYVHTI